MKDVCELLKQKEGDLARVRKELESLNIVAPLLADAAVRKSSDAPGSSDADDKLSISLSDAARTNAEDLFPSKFWNSQKRSG